MGKGGNMGFHIDNGLLIKYEEEAGITEIVIPDGVTSIGEKAFIKCMSLTTIVIPQGVISIGERAFERCNSLTDIVIPEGVTNIGKEAFWGCESLTSVVIPEGMTRVDDGTFGNCKSLTSIVIPENVTSIGEKVFGSCESLTSVIIPDQITSIPKSAFQWCGNLTTIVIPKSVTAIGSGAFNYCKSLTSIVIPQGVTNISGSAFDGCSNLTSINIPDGVTSIGDSVFFACKSLASIVIPKGVTSIGDSAFWGCSSLISIVIPESVTSIGAGAFKYCKGLTSVNIPKSVTKIEDSSFFGCESLTSIIIPEGVTSIGSEAFSGCSNLTSIVIPESVTSIGGGAFSGCESLTSLIIPESVTSIGDYAFSGCKSLTSMVIPQGVSSIGVGVFVFCTNLSRVVVREGVTSIGNSAFWNCRNLKTIEIGAGLTSIKTQAFGDCGSLTSVVVPMGVTSIGGIAFQRCSSLTSITIPESVTSIGEDVFEGCTALKEVDDILSLILNGSEIHNSVQYWLLKNIWNGPEFLSETAQVYLVSRGKLVKDICESRLFADYTASADVMLGLIENNLGNDLALKKIATFTLNCSSLIPKEKLTAIYEALRQIGAKTAAKLLEKAIQSSGLPKQERSTGHPIEALCLERFSESFVDKGLKSYHIPLDLFEGVHYKDSDKLAPAFVLKCAIFQYMQKLTELPSNVGDYRSDFVIVEPDSQIDEIANGLEREELQQLLERLVSEIDLLKQPRLLLPYCRYGSGKQMNALASLGRKWNNWDNYQAKGRRNIIVLHGAMLLNESREAMLLIEKWGLLDELAKRRNTTAEVLRDTALTEFDLDADGSKRYDLGNAVIAASIAQDLSVSLWNETVEKEVRSLPKKGADPEKYAAASEDFADLKKNIKNAVISKVENLKKEFVSGSELKTSEWKASYLNNYVLKRVASLLVWQWKIEGSTTRFMPTMDGTFIGCNGQPVEVSDAGSIAVAHPVEIPAEELECWKSLLLEKQLAQPFIQMFEPVCELDPSAVMSQYEGIELPLFLFRGLANEGINIEFIREDFVHFRLFGKAVSAQVRYGNYDELVNMWNVKIVGTRRAVNHEIYAMDKVLIENRVRNGDIAAVQRFSRGITPKTIQHLIDISIQVEQMEVTAWLMNYKNDHFPYTFADLEL